MMIGRLKGRTRGGMLVGAVLGAAASAACGASADIGFARKGPFEACLDSAYDVWLKAQAELQVKEDRRAKSLDDAAAAAWTAATLDACRKKGTAEAGSDGQFARYMARWREHVFDLAANIRKIGQSD
jgi:hypothetical protein